MIEIVCCSVDDCVEAEAGGAGRIELCGALEIGGGTPSLGCLIEAKRAVQIPIMAMVRPRGGGFDYSDREWETMLRDAALLLDAGADGIVFGMLHPDGTIQTERCRQLVVLAGIRDSVHHRAFDVTPDPFTALEQLIDCGVTRILSSGQKPTALEGSPLLAALYEKAAGRIEIMPGGGITAVNAAEVLNITHIPILHLAPWKEVPETSCQANTAIEFGGVNALPNDTKVVTDRNSVTTVSRIFSSAFSDIRPVQPSAP